MQHVGSFPKAGAYLWELRAWAAVPPPEGVLLFIFYVEIYDTHKIFLQPKKERHEDTKENII